MFDGHFDHHLLYWTIAEKISTLAEKDKVLNTPIVRFSTQNKSYQAMNFAVNYEFHHIWGK